MRELIIILVIFPLAALLLLATPSESQGGGFYQTSKSGVPTYTNIAPRERGYKRLSISDGVYRGSSYGYKAPRLGKFKYSEKYDHDINNNALLHGVDPNLVKAVIKVESNFNSMAVSPKGAMGMMQLMPGTAKILGVTEPFNPSENIRGGVAYLKKLMAMFGGDVKLALAGYNAGENAVIKHGYSIPPYAETRGYVESVLAHYNHLKNKSVESKKSPATKSSEL
ncbi:MAG: lytic transglycosylase domain-containing protein [Deltaproteobacteria bacterium]